MNSAHTSVSRILSLTPAFSHMPESPACTLSRGVASFRAALRATESEVGAPSAEIGDFPLHIPGVQCFRRVEAAVWDGS
eukprot:211910-Rhodomonas_salina.1